MGHPSNLHNILANSCVCCLLSPISAVFDIKILKEAVLLKVLTKVILIKV